MKIEIEVEDETWTKFKALCDVLGKDPITFVGENATDTMKNHVLMISEAFDGEWD
nr:hypothetical protein [Candidatus Sigynarchaeota archaeon]